MKFKHAFHIVIDNFSVTYKQLLYRLVVILLAALIGWAVLTPIVNDFIDSAALNTLINGVKTYILDFLKADFKDISEVSHDICVAYEQITHLLNTKIIEVVLTGLIMLVLLIIEKWFTGLGNYTTAVIINNKMSLRTSSSFIRTLISHFKEAALYSLIYVPMSVLYDVIVAAALFAVLFLMLNGSSFLFVSVFIFALIMVVAIAFKMTFTCDWLPALIRGKMGQRKAIAYTFSRKNKNTFNVFSNFVVVLLIAMAVNIAAFFFTVGVGILLTLPASFMMIISFEMVNYYDREELRYFLDKNTIVKPEKEFAISREQFFKGSDLSEKQ